MMTEDEIKKAVLVVESEMDNLKGDPLMTMLRDSVVIGVVVNAMQIGAKTTRATTEELIRASLLWGFMLHRALTKGVKPDVTVH